MKNFLLAAVGSLVLLAGAGTAQAQDRGYRGGPSANSGSYDNNRGYSNNNNNDRYDSRGYNNGNRRMSHADILRMRRYQQRRQSARRDWAYQQGMRDSRRSSYSNRRGGSCGNNNGRW